MNMSRALPLRGRGLASALLLAAAAGCGRNAEPPAPFDPPSPGTVFLYRDVANVSLETEGIRTRYMDQQGRIGERVGLFFTDNPDNRARIDSTALMRLWPLEPGKSTVVEIQRGEEVYDLELQVSREERVTTPAGTYDTFIVQGVETPRLVRNPADATTVMHSWWYAPEVQNVVRFRSTYLTGPAQGRVIGDRLVEITDRESYEEARRARADTAAPDAPGGGSTGG